MRTRALHRAGADCTTQGLWGPAKWRPPGHPAHACALTTQARVPARGAGPVGRRHVAPPLPPTARLAQCAFAHLVSRALPRICTGCLEIRANCPKFTQNLFFFISF